MKIQYPRAAQAIRRLIIQNKLPPGAPVPSTRTLAVQLGFNHAAVARGCNVLIAGGLLRRTGYKMSVGRDAASGLGMEGVVEVVSYFEDFTRVADRILTERGVDHRLTELSWTQNPTLEPVLEEIFSRKPAGLILRIGGLRGGKPPGFEAIDVPMIVCADGFGPTQTSVVQADSYRGVDIALGHLFDLGHRQVAHLLFDDFPMGELADSHRSVCLKLGLKASPSLVWRAEVREEGAARETVSAGLRRHRGVTALVCDVPAAIWITKHFAVPEKLSVVGFGPGGAEASPPLTTVSLPDPDCVPLWACTEIISQLQTIQSGRPPRPPSRALFVPSLVRRASTRALSLPKPVPKLPGESPVAKPDPWETWRKVYPFLRKIRSPIWVQLDLSRLANHSMTRHHGWLGAEPLKHFPPGLRSIHGVPFQVLDEERNGGRAVVTFRSPHSRFAGAKLLPVAARLKVQAKVRALYFLHGCGYAQPVPYAGYTMHYREGPSAVVPLIPIGHSRSHGLKRLGPLKPNVQDWWAEFEHLDFPHAYRALVFDPARPGAYERAIYSLEWINPRPDAEVSSIEVRVAPEIGPALALIAATALLRH